MKNTTFLACLISTVLSFQMNAQVSAYSFSQSSGTYVPISGGTLIQSTSTTVSIDDNVYTALNIGFNFNYAGTDYTTFSINANGFIAMGNAIVSSYTPISTGTTNNVVSALGVDLIGRQFVTCSMTSGSNVLTVTAGSTSGMSVGDLVTGNGIATGSTITAITPTSITLSLNVTSSGTGRNIRSINCGTIRYETIGTAPNRKLVVQWSKFSRYATTAPSDLLNFQIILEETSNLISTTYDFPYIFTSTSVTPQVGLRGAANTDFNNRTTTTNWASTTAGTVNSSNCTLSSTVFPASGQMFSWSPPACGAPGGLSSVLTSTTSANISWNNNAAATSGFDYYVSTTNTAPTAGTTPTGSTVTNSASVSGLTANTTYYFWVRSNCGSGILSNWSASGTFFTGYCVPTSNCSFGDVIASVVLNTLSNVTGTACATVAPTGYSNFTGNPALTTTLLPSSSYTITVGANAYAQSVAVWIDYNDDLIFDNVTERVGNTLAASPIPVNGTASFTITMGCTPPAGVHRMRIRSSDNSFVNGLAQTPCTNYSYGETEDYLITVAAAPACPSPSSLTSTPTGITSTSASFSWTLGCSVATNYDFEYGPAGFIPGTGTGTLLTNQAATIAAGSGSYTLTGLIANTSYDVYFRANCGGTQSGWSPMINVYTGHCIPSSTSLLLWLSNVTTTGGVTNFNNSSTLSVNGYGDYTATQSVSAVAGNSFSLSANYNVSGYYYFAKVWVDWNNDLDFNDAGETMYTTPLFSGTMPFSVSLTVPAGQANGNYRMRVRLDGGDSYFDGLLDPCGTYTYGETEDYTLSVIPNCSAAPANPVAAVTGTTPICYGLTTTMAATGSTLEGGISNQWAYSTTPNGPYTNFSGAAGLNYTTLNNLTPNTYYIVLNSTCSFTSQSSSSNEISLTIDGASSNFSMVPASYCGVGGTSTLTASPSVSGATYTWTNNGGTLSTLAGDNTSATLSQTSEFTLNASYNGCSSQTTQSIGVYSFPSILPTATPSTICGGTSSLLETGLSAANFVAICITPAPEASPTMGYTDLVINGVANVPQTSGNLDDGGWGNIPLGFGFNFFGTNFSTINVGTNGVLQLGNYDAVALGDFTIGALPNLVDPLAAIFASAGDLRIGGLTGYNGNLRYWTAGATPNRKFILDYQGYRYGNSSQNVKFQVVIYETIGQVDVIVLENAAGNNKTIGINSPSGTIGAAAPNCAAVPITPGYWQATTNTIPASSPQAFKFIPPVNYVYNWTLNGTPNPGQDQLNGAAVNTTSTTQSPLSSTNYQVYIQDPITNCTQIFQTPVIVLPTPVAPIAVDWTQCGTQVPQANVSCPTCTGNETFNWYTAATNGSLYQGVINENFNTGTTTGTLYGDAALTGARCVLTQNVASQNGALLLGSTGVNSNAYNINFDFQAGPSDALGYNGADGFSYSFGDDVDATAVSPAAENGSGSKLKVGFVSYTNGGSTRGIYLMYNCPTDEQTPTTPGVIAYVNDISWKNTATPVAFQMTIDNTGQVNLSLNGNPIFTNVQLPANYLLENKATWLQLFKARTGDGFSRHAIDNVNVEAQPSQQFATIQQPVSTSATYYVQTIDGLCGSTTLTPVSITVNPAPAFGITSNITGCQNNVYPISVTAGLNDFTNFVWSPAGILFMDQALTTPYVVGTSASTVYFSAANVGVQPAISCSATDGGIGSLQCGASASMTFTVQANPLAPTIASGVQAVCSGSSTTLDVQAGSLGASYCASSAGFTGDTEITNVTIGTLNQTSDCFTPGTGAASVLEQYADYTSGAGAPAAPSLTAGTNVAGSVTVGTCGFTNYTSGLAIFIDLNQDGDFTDADEKVYSNGGVDNIDCVPATDVLVSLVIPANALNGTTRMRVVNRESISGDAITPCTVNGWGETEDYLVNITGGITYTYTWSPAVTGNATTASVTTLPLTTATTYTAVLNDGLCSSAPSAPITVAIAGTPVVTPTASVPINNYCTSSANFTDDEEITNVTLGTLNQTSDCFTPGTGATSVLEQYSDYTSGAGAPAAPSITAGTTVAGSVTVSSCGSPFGFYNYTSGLAIFIDLNQDGDFTDAGEKVYSNGGVDNIDCVPATDVPVSLVIPANALNGTTRMRVINRESMDGNTITPCGNQYYGEVEDYLVNITGGVVNIPCPGATFNLNAVSTNGGEPYTYSWSVLSGNATISNPAIASPTALVSSDATFQVTVNDACGLSSFSTVSANIDENPIAVTPVSTAICINNNTVLTAANGITYSWTPNNTLSTNNTAAVTASPTTNTQYTVVGTYGNGCVGSATTTVTVNPLPIVSAGLDQTICLNTQVVLNGSGATSYAWNNSVNNGVAFTPASTNNYTVTGTDGNGCVNTDVATVTVLPLPNVSAGQDYAICNGFGATLTGNGANTYTWNNNVNNGVIFFPNTTQTYVVTGTGANGCSNLDTITVTVNNTPVISLTNGGSSCANGTVALSATTTNAYGGFWSATNGGGVLSPNVSNSNVVYNANLSDPSTVNFSYVAFNQCGSTTANTSISVLSLPTVNAGLNQTACTNSNVTLTATSNGTVVWNSNLLNGIAFAAAQGTTSYVATATGTNGCTNTDTVTVIGQALPDVGAGEDQIVCAGESVTLNGSGANSYTWSNNVINGVPFTPTASGQYSVTGTGSNGCTNQDNVTVTVNALPNAIVISADPVTLVASPAGATYQWINCATGQAIADADNDSLVATSNGSYAVIVTNANGCSDTSVCTIVDQVGIYFPESAFIGLYPNPTNSIVTLELPADDGAIAHVFDSQGKLIISISNAKNGEQFDLSTLSTGVYTFRVTLNNLTHIEKVVKQ